PHARSRAPRASSGLRRVPPGAELEDGPPALRRGASQRAVGVDGDGVADRLEERHVRVRIGVRRALGEVEAAAGGELAHAFRLVLGVERTYRPARVLAVRDLADRAERAVEAEVVRDRVDDLLQRRRDDVDAVAA